MSSLDEIGSVMLEIFYCTQFVSYFVIKIRHGKECIALYLNKIESLSPMDALCEVWLKWPCRTGEEDF